MDSVSVPIPPLWHKLMLPYAVPVKTAYTTTDAEMVVDVVVPAMLVAETEQTAYDPFVK